MATIVARPGKTGTRYTAQIRTKGHTEAKTFSTKTAAKDWARRREIELKDKPHLAGTEAHKRTLADAIDRYTKDVLPSLSDSAQRDRPPILAWWREHYGKTTLAAFQAPQIAEARDTLRRTPKQRGTGTLTPATVNKRLLILSHLLSTAAKEWHWIPVNPMAGVNLLKVDNASERYLSKEEMAALLRACRESESPYLLPIVLVALTTGARNMEIRGLRWRDVDLERGTVTFGRTKNGETRSAGLVPEVVELLKPRKGAPATLVFPGKVNPDKPALIRTAWETALQRAGIEGFRFHDLRHTAASYLAMSGATLPELAGALGHKTLAMVKRYSHLNEQHIRSVTDRLAAVVDSADA